jgi:hypothetical protein
VRQAVHNRIPQPTEQDIAETEARKWLELLEGYLRIVKREQAGIADLEDAIQRKHDLIAALRPILDDIAEGERTPETYDKYDLSLIRLLASRLGAG